MRTPPGRLLAAVLLLSAVLACRVPFARGTLGLLGDAHPDVLYSVETDAGVVALTIDDGPDAVSTLRILGLLAEHDARATFFLIGERIPGNEAVVDAIVAGGHELGNHGTRDVPSIDLAPPEFERDLLHAHATLSAWGAPHWFRPGSGWYDDAMVETAQRHGYRTALGSAYPFDAQLPWTGLARRLTLWRADRGAVIILHDGPERGARTVETLSRVLPELRQRGLRVVTLSELTAVAEEPLPAAAGE